MVVDNDWSVPLMPSVSLEGVDRLIGSGRLTPRVNRSFSVEKLPDAAVSWQDMLRSKFRFEKGVPILSFIALMCRFEWWPGVPSASGHLHPAGVIAFEGGGA